MRRLGAQLQEMQKRLQEARLQEVVQQTQEVLRQEWNVKVPGQQ